MMLNDLLFRLSAGTPVRIRILRDESGLGDIVGTTGGFKTQRILDKLALRKCHESCVVTAIYPLFKAQELYIECVKVV